ncbi:hypothetical protein J2Z35_002449 [Acetoanaerobium pronyense]|uniref:MobA/VirD2-like nuclease domain-containing protein n=1 Tax=Acetoanaerobium pronyense TaxID=1482736 RepID=A0ABS4KLE9_9FIRM|nr:relaxase/mobilization nuclease domain-containing protein [Acetoanaerobium pronyense]MBP2028619.1 hypothetical protein [Acetoanaerobium pronyense]
MAYVKIKPIHSNVEKALNYITNPDKTADGILVSSYACSTSPHIAKLEFDLVTNISIKKRTNSVIARHLIQSFSPEDNVTPEQANKIGNTLAEEVLKKDYQYIIATHIDQNHIHNHIIFNTTSIIDNKKYRSNKYTYQNIQKISDKLCKENSLSIIPRKINQNKGKSYKEYIETQKGNSWKEVMKNDIDSVVIKVITFADFLEEMKNLNYTVKQGKHLAFQHENQSRFTRGKTLGEKYSEESIRYRIENPNTVELNKMIEMNERNKCKGAGFKKFAAKKNIDELSKMTKFMAENNINSLSNFEKLYKSNLIKINNIEETMYYLKNQIEERNATINSIITWKKTKDIYDKYVSLKGLEKEIFKIENKDNISNHEKVKLYLKEKYIESKIPKMSKLKEEILDLESKLKKTSLSYYSAKQDLKALSSLKNNIKTILKDSNLFI